MALGALMHRMQAIPVPSSAVACWKTQSAIALSAETNVTLEVYVGLLTMAPSGHKIEQYQMFLRKYAPCDLEKKVHQSLEQIILYEVLFIQVHATSNHYLSVLNRMLFIVLLVQSPF
jgi:hypothetical protein